jgi:hypothetical protein
MAFLSFEFIERPFRGTNSVFTSHNIFVLGLTGSLTTAAIGFAVYFSHGLPQRYDLRTRQLVAENYTRRSDYIVTCGNWRKQIQSLADLNFCQLGSPSSKKIMFLGDSHVGQLFPVISKIYNDGDLKGRGVLVAIAQGCLPAENLNTVGGDYYCDTFSKFAIMRAEEKDVGTVFIGFNTEWSYHDGMRCAVVDGRCTKTLSRAEVGQIFLTELADHIRVLRSLGKRVIVCLPFPMYDKSIPELETRNAVLGKFGLSGTATDLTSPALRERLRLLADNVGAEVFDPRATLCPGSSCITEINGVSIYRDSDHIAASEVALFESNLSQVLSATN